MKKVLTFFVLIFSVTLCFSQEINEVDFLTSGKWNLQSIQIGDETQDFSKESSWMVFHADGKYQIKMSENTKNGNWKFDENEKAIQFHDEENEMAGFKIKMLNQKQLLVIASEGDVAYTMTLTK